MLHKFKKIFLNYKPRLYGICVHVFLNDVYNKYI